MVRVTCSRILRLSKPYFGWGTQSSSRCFISRANITTKIIPSSLRDVSTRQTWQQNRSFIPCTRIFHDQMTKDDYHQSVTIETFDALCKEGRVYEAVEAGGILKNKGFVLDLTRLLGLAKLCGQAEALVEAKVVHECIKDTVSPPLDVASYNTVLKMYSGCESTDDAVAVFEEMDEKNSETWCVIMRCLAKNGYGELAIDMFTRFKEERNKPDKEIFKAVLFACASLGDVNEGLLHFKSMYRDYGIIPSMEEYVSLTEMLAACGHLDEALELVERMTVDPSVEVWETLMNLCWVHGDLELGDRLAELVKRLDATKMKKESNAGLVAAKEKFKESRRRPHQKSELMRTFKTGDTSHPESDRFIPVLKSLKVHMLEMGFVPAIRLVQKMEDEDKEQQLLFRSDKIAFAHAVLNSEPRAPVTIMKSMRLCIDGHNSCKMFSLITGRLLILRESKRFHHFKDGVCSCKDYW